MNYLFPSTKTHIVLFQIEDSNVDPEWTLLFYLRNKCILPPNLYSSTQLNKLGHVQLIIFFS